MTASADAAKLAHPSRVAAALSPGSAMGRNAVALSTSFHVGLDQEGSREDTYETDYRCARALPANG